MGNERESEWDSHNDDSNCGMRSVSYTCGTPTNSRKPVERELYCNLAHTRCADRFKVGLYRGRLIADVCKIDSNYVVWAVKVGMIKMPKHLKF